MLYLCYCASDTKLILQKLCSAILLEEIRLYYGMWQMFVVKVASRRGKCLEAVESHAHLSVNKHMTHQRHGKRAGHLVD